MNFPCNWELTFIFFKRQESCLMAQKASEMARCKGFDTIYIITESTTTSLYRKLIPLSGLFYKTHKLKCDWIQYTLY